MKDCIRDIRHSTSDTGQRVSRVDSRISHSSDSIQELRSSKEAQEKDPTAEQSIRLRVFISRTSGNPPSKSRFDVKQLHSRHQLAKSRLPLQVDRMQYKERQARRNVVKAGAMQRIP